MSRPPLQPAPLPPGGRLTEGDPLLAARGLSKRYGGLTALDDVSLDVRAGEIAALIGPNGAGKTTLFGCLTGTETSDAGTVTLAGVDLTGLGSDVRARQGLGRTFQRLSTFAGMSVADNLLVAAEARRPQALLKAVLAVRDREAQRDRELVAATLALVGLSAVANEPAGRLPAGTLRLVELARALCRQPRVLLLDEPAAGLDDSETAALVSVLRAVASTGVGVLLVEHDVQLVFAVATRVYVLAQGRLLTEGSPAEVRADPRVRAAYLGPGQ